MKFLKDLSYETKRKIAIICLGVCFVVGVNTIANGFNKLNNPKDIEVNTAQAELQGIILEKDNEIEALSIRLDSLENQMETLSLKNESYKENLIESTKEKTFVTAVDKGYVKSVELHCSETCECNGDINYPSHLYTIRIRNTDDNTIDIYKNIINPKVYTQKDIQIGETIGEMYHPVQTRIIKDTLPLD